jgi:aldose sugar dehydrogenase
MSLGITILMMSLVLIGISFSIFYHVTEPAIAQPSINDSNLTTDLIVDGLASPTSIAFLDSNNILLLEKEGSVRLISNGQIQPEPVLQLQGVQSNNERGLLGIEVMDNNVLLYVTESGAQVEGIPTEGDVRNRVYSYAWDGTSLTNPQLLLDLPAGPGTNHQGGKLKIGPDNQLYVVVGEMQRDGQLQNIQSGPAPDDTGVIFRISPTDGSPAPNNPFSTDVTDPLSKYYAYGIRNSFGIDFDPITGKLWDAENGEDVFDEINVVNSGFNSGWKLVMGPIATNTDVSESDLVNIPGSHYADPVFSWAESRGITDIEFFDSAAFGPSYENGIFVGDITTGTLFYFEPNADRTGLNLNGDPSLSNLVADSDEEMSAVTLGTGFVGITDIETGPDGSLYILTFDRGAEGQGSLYRILPPVQGGTTTDAAAADAIPPPSSPAPAPAPDVIPPPTVNDDDDEDDTEEQDVAEQDDEDVGDDESEDNNGEE